MRVEEGLLRGRAGAAPVLQVAVYERAQRMYRDRTQRQRFFLLSAFATFTILKIAGYDGQFILKWIHQYGFVPKVIPRGLEIIELEHGGVRLLDSLNYLPMPLSAIPKAMGFDAAKGYFPHLFNRRENWGKIFDTLPDAELVFFVIYFVCTNKLKIFQPIRTIFDESRGTQRLLQMVPRAPQRPIRFRQGAAVLLFPRCRNFDEGMHAFP